MSLSYRDYCGYFPFAPSDYDKISSAGTWAQDAPAVEVNPYHLTKIFWLAKHATITLPGLNYSLTRTYTSGDIYTDDGVYSIPAPAPYQGGLMQFPPQRHLNFNNSGSSPTFFGLIDSSYPGSTPLPSVSCAHTRTSSGPSSGSSSPSHDTTSPLIFINLVDLLYSRATRKWYVSVYFDLDYLLASASGEDEYGDDFIPVDMTFELQIDGVNVLTTPVPCFGFLTSSP